MTTKPHDWPNPTPAETVENPDGTITYEGRRYVPAGPIERQRDFFRGLAAEPTTEPGSARIYKLLADTLQSLLGVMPSPEKEDRDDG